MSSKQFCEPWERVGDTCSRQRMMSLYTLMLHISSKPGWHKHAHVAPAKLLFTSPTCCNSLVRCAQCPTLVVVVVTRMLLMQ